MAHTLVELVQNWQAKPPVDSDIKPDQGAISKFPYRTTNPTEMNSSAQGYLKRTHEVMRQVAPFGTEIKDHKIKNQNGNGIAADVQAANVLEGDIPRMVVGGARPVVQRVELPVAQVVAAAPDQPVQLPAAPAVPIVAREDINYNPTAKFWRAIKPLQNIGWDEDLNIGAIVAWYTKLSEEDREFVGKTAGRIVGFNAVEVIVVPAVALKGDQPDGMKEWERLCEIVAVQLLRGEEQWYNITGHDPAMAEYWDLMWKGIAEYAPLFGHMKGNETLRPFYEAIWGNARIYIEEKLNEGNEEE